MSISKKFDWQNKLIDLTEEVVALRAENTRLKEQLGMSKEEIGGPFLSQQDRNKLLVGKKAGLMLKTSAQL